MLERQAASIVQPDVGNTGGIMEAKKIAAMAEAYNMRVAPHNAAGPICTAADLQLDACISNFLIQEVYPFRVPETYEIVDRARARDPRRPAADLGPARPGRRAGRRAGRTLPLGPLSVSMGSTPARSPRRSTGPCPEFRGHGVPGTTCLSPDHPPSGH